MKKKWMLVADEDRAYVTILVNYIVMSGEELYEAHGVTDPDVFLNMLEDGDSFVFMAGESMLKQVLQRRSAIKAREDVFGVVLTEGIRKSCLTDYPVLNRYQRADDLLHAFHKLCSEHGFENPERVRSSCRCAGFYAPSGGCLQTSMSLTYAMLLSDKYRTLWLSTEAVGGIHLLTGCLPRMDMSDLTLGLLRREGNLSGMLEDVKKKMDNLDYLPGPVLPDDVWNVRCREWFGLMELVKEECGYERIVWDLGHGMDGLPEILGNCEEIYMPLLHGRLSEAKREVFCDRMSRAWPEVAQRIRTLDILGLPPCGLEYEVPEELPYGPLGDFIQETVMSYV